MPDQQRSNTLYPIIKNAADLLLKCAGYLDDLNAAKRDDDHHCDTYYAIDADVIILYLQPELNAEYLDIFGEGKTSTPVISLTLMLGDFLVASGETLIPGCEKQKSRFLLVPPHDEELFRTLSAIHRDLLRKVSSVDTRAFEKLSHVFEAFEQSKDENTLLQALLDCTPSLVELYNPYLGPKAALERYARLPETTLQRIDTYLENGFTFPLLDPINKSEDRKQADKMIHRWEVSLKKKSKSRKPAYAIRDDAEVLATIEYVNDKLRYEGKQVVLVTGSGYLFKAADTYRPYPSDKRSFSDLYLRHPQAFLSHEKFFFGENPTESSSSNPEQSTFKLLDWLNLFFPSELNVPNQPQGQVRRDALRDIREGGNRSFETVLKVIDRPDNDPRSINRLLEAWKTQVASVANRRYAGGIELAEERGAKTLAQSLNKLRINHQWTIDNLRKMVFNESLGSISTLYSMTVWFGLWSKATREQSKGIPVLRIDSSHREIEEYCEAVVQMQLESVHKRVSAESLEKLYILSKQVEEKDLSLYLAHVVHALAFAAKGHWYATLTLADIALAIVDNMDPAIRGVRKGREAAYLACIAKRRSAKDRKGLDEATKYLQEAYAREDKGAKEDIRFLSESLTIDTRSYYFSHFREGENLDIKSVTATIDALRRLLGAANDERDDGIKRWVLRQTFTNYFSLLLIARDLKWDDILPGHENVVSELEIFKNVLNEDEESGYKQKQDDDPYAYLIYNICICIWHADQNRQKDAKKNALEAINIWVKFAMPYDEERLKLLKRSITE